MTKEEARNIMLDLKEQHINVEIRLALDMAIEALKAQEWTSVIYPPKEYGWYLTQTVRGVIDKKYYGVHKEKDKSLIGWGDTDMGEYPHYSHHHPKNKVIAWMPLPEPYKAESEE